MKSPKAIVLLLILNLGVFAGILYHLRRAPLAGPATSDQAVASELAATAPATADPSVVVVTNDFRWAQLESEEYKDYIARLRSIGCPEQTIRDIIIADLDKVLAPSMLAASGRRTDLKYWHSVEEELANDVDPDEVAKKQRDIEKRKREIIRELVNIDLARERLKQQGQEDYYERRLSFLPEERRSYVREILERYDEAEQAIREAEADADGELSATARARLHALEKQRDEELKKFLSPQEKTQQELWLSPTANAVRYALYGMNATEEEFLAIYHARKTFDDKWADAAVPVLPEALQSEREQDRAAVAEAIRQALGEQRYAEFERGEDEDFHLLSAATTRAKVPKEKAAEVYGYKLLVQGVRGQINGDPTLPAEQREQALKEIATEAEKAVRAALGEKGYQRYLSSGGGKWIKE